MGQYAPPAASSVRARRLMFASTKRPFLTRDQAAQGAAVSSLHWFCVRCPYAQGSAIACISSRLLWVVDGTASLCSVRFQLLFFGDRTCLLGMKTTPVVFGRLRGFFAKAPRRAVRPWRGRPTARTLDRSRAPSPSNSGGMLARRSQQPNLNGACCRMLGFRFWAFTWAMTVSCLSAVTPTGLTGRRSTWSFCLRAVFHHFGGLKGKKQSQARTST